MNSNDAGPRKAYKNDQFLNSSEARPVRILSELIEPQVRLRDENVSDVIVFFGSARILARDEAKKNLAAAKKNSGDVARAERDLSMSQLSDVSAYGTT